MEPNTLRYAAVPTLPLSGGKLENGDCYPLLIFLLLGQPAAEIICYEPACSVSLIFSDVATVHEMCSIRSRKSSVAAPTRTAGVHTLQCVCTDMIFNLQ